VPFDNSAQPRHPPTAPSCLNQELARDIYDGLNMGSFSGRLACGYTKRADWDRGGRGQSSYHPSGGTPTPLNLGPTPLTISQSANQSNVWLGVHIHNQACKLCLRLVHLRSYPTANPSRRFARTLVDDERAHYERERACFVRERTSRNRPGLPRERERA